MTRHLIDDFVSIYSLPELDTTHLNDTGAQITIGDLHGNTMKLVFLLVRHGVITNMNVEKYDELVRIYRANIDTLTSEDINKFNDIINNLTFNTTGMIRLLGDEMCDRGSNDYFTLKLLSKLSSAKVPFEIILSNHSAEFIEAYETKLKFFPSILENHFANSMINMQILIARKLVAREDIRTMIREAYKPSLKAISYSLSEDNASIMIYSHASIDLRTIRALAKKLSLPFHHSSILALAKSIDAINAAYQTHVNQNTVHTLYDKEIIESAYNVTPFPTDMYPFEYTMWNRDLRFLHQPETHKGYQLFFTHGHDSEISENKNVFNLDNQLGKTANSGLGQYTVLYSHDHSLTPTATVNDVLFSASNRTSTNLFARTSTTLRRESQMELERKSLSH